MEPRTLGVIILGQAGGRTIEEASSMLDATVPPIAGQPASRVASGLAGGIIMVAPVFMKNINPDLQVALAVAGSHALTDAVADGVKEAMMGSGMGVPAAAAPGAGMGVGMGMQPMQVINGSLVD